MEKGCLAIVLHAHLPYVHHPDHEDFIEERWLFEAITETYLPLLDVFEGLLRERIDFRITMSFTPTLLTMLHSPLLQKRYEYYIDNLIELARKEVLRTAEDEPLHALANMYFEKFSHLRNRFVHTYQSNIISGFRKLQDSGHLEAITSSATHAFLPYIKTEQAVRAQIENAVKIHYFHFGRLPKGIWLPECGYKEGIDLILKEYGIRFFLTDTHGVLHAYPSPQYGVYGPILTSHGVAAFARDFEASKQVWSSMEGYPGDADYREYYRDIGYDLDYDYLKPHLHNTGIRLNTGIKYYRITGSTERKDPYVPQWAERKAAVHAGNFMFNREKQIEHLAARMNRKPIIVASYDAELFGHWWYEGPIWLDYLCRKIHYDQQTLRMITPAQYLETYPENEQCELSFSSWGRGGYGEVWLGQWNEWIYRHLHRMEERMIESADQYPNVSGVNRRALNQMARELLLAQSSDWAFIMDNRTMVDYALNRTKQHIGRFSHLYEMLHNGHIDDIMLTKIENEDQLFPDMDYRVFLSGQMLSQITAETNPKSPLKVLMLSWEYPPMVVGGLSRHVFDLSRHLVKQGIEVHVATCHVSGYPSYEVNQGVHVHRVRTYQSADIEFMEWVFQLNLVMFDYCKHLINHYGEFHILHAHDWLVCYASKMLKQHFQLPLTATIHATEHGRNQGIYSETQHLIHSLEWELTYEAGRVIACSRYMEEEIKRLFQLPVDKLDIIPNGVDFDMLQVSRSVPGLKERIAYPNEKVVFFVGRLVREKGVHILLDSVPSILEQVPEAKFVISGKGPLLDHLQDQVRAMGMEHKVLFTGFIDDESRNELLSIASVAVFPSLYEPFGIVALEAMAAGVPVIVSGIGGLQEIVQYGEDGFTILPDDVPSIASHVIKVLRDDELASEMTLKAKHKVLAVYNWNTIAKKTMHHYYDLLSQANPESHSSDSEIAVSKD